MYGIFWVMAVRAIQESREDIGEANASNGGVNSDDFHKLLERVMRYNAGRQQETNHNLLISKTSCMKRAPNPSESIISIPSRHALS